MNSDNCFAKIYKDTTICVLLYLCLCSQFTLYVKLTLIEIENELN